MPTSQSSTLTVDPPRAFTPPAAPVAGVKLNLGCGPVQPPGWVNIDASNRARLASKLPWVDQTLVRLGVLHPTSFGPQVTIHDLTRPLPYADGSVASIYSGELWEHFEYDDAARLTAECHRVLAPGGVLRVCVPDGPTFWRRYLELYEAELARPRSERSGEQLRAHVAMYFQEIATRRVWLGSMGHKHKWQFDDVQLIEMFERAGFTEVARMPFHVSRIPDVHLLERSDFCIVEGIRAPRGG